MSEKLSAAKSLDTCYLDDSFEEFKIQPRKLRKTQSTQELRKQKEIEAPVNDLKPKSDIADSLIAETSESTLFSKCPVCGDNIGSNLLAKHIESCCKNKFAFSKKVLSDSNQNSKSIICSINYGGLPKKEVKRETCSVCDKDITHMNKQRRLQHVNRCVDSSPLTDDKLEELSTFPCPFCGINSTTSEIRINHLKRCANKLNLKPEVLVAAAELQEKHTAERKALGLPVLAKPKLESKKRKRTLRINQPKNAADAELQMAMALSASLAEERSSESSAQELDPAEMESKSLETSQFLSLFVRPTEPAVKKGRGRKKKAEKIYHLALQSDEDRRQLIERKVAELLEFQQPQCLTTMNWRQKDFTRCPLWLMSAMKGTLTREAFYVRDLTEHIETSKVEVGNRLQHFRLSQVAGRNSLGNKSALDKSGPLITGTQSLSQNVSFGREGYSFAGFLSQRNSDNLSSSKGLAFYYSNLVGKADYSDAVVRTEDGQIPVHLAIIFARFPQLLNDFEGNPKELNLLEFNRSTVLNFFEYVYTGECFTDNDVSKLSTARVKDLAEKYNMSDLIEYLNEKESEIEEEKDHSVYKRADRTLHNIIHSIWQEPNKTNDTEHDSDSDISPRQKICRTVDEEQCDDIMFSLSRFISQDGDKSQFYQAKGIIELSVADEQDNISAAEETINTLEIHIPMELTEHSNEELNNRELDDSDSRTANKVDFRDSENNLGKSSLFADRNVIPASSFETTVCVEKQTCCNSYTRMKGIHPILPDDVPVPEMSFKVSLDLNEHSKSKKVTEPGEGRDNVFELVDKLHTPKTVSRGSLREKLRQGVYVVEPDSPFLDEPTYISGGVTKSPRTPKRSPPKKTSLSSPTSSGWLTKSSPKLAEMTTISDSPKWPALIDDYNLTSMKTPPPCLRENLEDGNPIQEDLHFSERMSSPDIFADDFEDEMDVRLLSPESPKSYFKSHVSNVTPKQCPIIKTYLSSPETPLPLAERLKQFHNETLHVNKKLDLTTGHCEDPKMRVLNLSPDKKRPKLDNESKKIFELVRNTDSDIPTSECLANTVEKNDLSSIDTQPVDLNDSFGSFFSNNDLPEVDLTDSRNGGYTAIVGKGMKPREMSVDTPKMANPKKNKLRREISLSQPILKKTVPCSDSFSQPVTKKNGPITPITPMPEYKTMVTPELKAALKKVGVKPLPRSKAARLLTHIYDQTHPYVTEEPNALPTQSAPIIPKITSKESAQEIPRTCTIPEDSSSSLSSSQGSNSSSTSSIVLEESTIVDCDQVADVDVKTRLRNYFRSNHELHEQILCYEPIPLKDLHGNLKESGFKLPLPMLMDFLDEQCITFTMPRSEKQKQKQNIRSQRFRKRMKAAMNV